MPVAVLGLCLLAACSDGPAQEIDPLIPPAAEAPIAALELEAQTGEAPFTVRTLNTGRDGDCVRSGRFSSHGIEISWGDGSADPTFISDLEAPCPPFGVHTYTIPGTYEITVMHWAVGAADGIIPLGSQTTSVTVTGTSVQEQTTLNFESVLEGFGRADNTILYNTQHFYIAHQPSELMTLNVSLQLPDGTVLNEMRPSKPMIAHNGTTLVLLEMSDERRAILRDVLAGHESTPAILILKATSPDGETLKEERVDLTLSALFPNSTTLCPSRDHLISVGEDAVRTITYSRGNQLSYEVDWGDGTVEQDTIPAWKLTSWRVGTDNRKLELTHTYSKPGVYAVKVRQANSREAVEPGDIIGICKALVTVE